MYTIEIILGGQWRLPVGQGQSIVFENYPNLTPQPFFRTRCKMVGFLRLNNAGVSGIQPLANISMSIWGHSKSSASIGGL